MDKPSVRGLGFRVLRVKIPEFTQNRASFGSRAAYIYRDADVYRVEFGLESSCWTCLSCS